jgi:nitroreductase
MIHQQKNSIEPKKPNPFSFAKNAYFPNMQQRIKQILELAVRAPSGENCQPWRFEIHSNQIDVHNIPERDTSLYNWGQRPSYAAHGALLENIQIASPAFGYTPYISLFPEPTKPNYIAHITFQESPIKIHPLYSYITERTTNRKPYKNLALTDEQRQRFSQTPEGINPGKLIFLENEDDKHAVAKAVAGNERILFENSYMHKFFYDHITWTEQEDRDKKIGFYIKTFELPPPAEKMFKLAKNPGFVRNANRIGFSKIIAKQNAKIYASCSAIGAIVMPSNAPEDFLLAGRLMQRVWLTATQLGLSLQPLTGILFLMQGILENRIDQLTKQQQSFIKIQYNQLKHVFRVEQETITMIFRIGDGGKPTARSLRLKPQFKVSL